MGILDLPNLIAEHQELTDRGYEITAKSAYEPDFCPLCGTVKPILSKFGKRRQTFMDLPIHGERVGVLINRQRYRCKDCCGAFYELLQDMDENHLCTRRFKEYVELQSLKRTFKSLAEELGVTEGTIRNIFNRFVDALDGARELKTPEWMGIDEIHILGKPRGVITNVKSNALVDLLINRNKETVVHYLRQMRDTQDIQIVTMDMWNPYRQAVREVIPDAEIVVDKFHIVRMGNQAVEDIRKTIRKGLDTKERRQLKNDRFILLKRRKDLNASQQIILDSWTGNFPELRQAYELKESFYDIWDSNDAKEASERYNEWQKTIPSAMRSAFSDVTSAYRNWNREINNYFTYRATNAYTESMNNLIRAVNRMGRGYSFKALRAKMLFDTPHG